MIKIKEKLKLSININNFYNDKSNEDVIFFDIETTGFSREKSIVYLIGYIYYSNKSWYFEQLLIENVEEEKDLVNDFYNKSNEYNTFIHYNGNSFDIPYMTAKCTRYSHSIKLFKNNDSIDLYTYIKPYKTILRLENCKLKTIEKYLNINRIDTFSGGDLIKQFYTFIATKKESLKNNLLLHNREDIINLIQLLIKLNNIINFFSNLHNKYDINDISSNEKYFQLNINSTVLCPINFDTKFNNIKISAFKDCYDVNINIPIVYNTFLYYFDNYKDYYYIPEKDEAVHKSLAKYYTLKKVKAKASNCYIKKSGDFLPIINRIDNIHAFKKEYKDKNQYILLNELENKENLMNYINSILITLEAN